MLLDAGTITSDPVMFFSHDNFASPFRNYITANRLDERLDIIATNVDTATFKAGNVGIGTSTPAATLEVNGTTKFDGLATFAGGQTFPGTGTVTSVSAGAGLTGGPITTTGTLSIALGGVNNSMLANPSIMINTNSGLTGGGPVNLGGSLSLGIASNSCSPGSALRGLPFNCQPFASLGPNSFNGPQTININSGGTALFAASTGSGSTGVFGSSNDVAGGNGSAGYFQNTAGGTILIANDGNNNVISVDTNGLNIEKAIVISAPNDPATGTVLNELAKLSKSSGQTDVTVTSAGDPGGAIGVVVSGAGTASTSANAVVAVIGTAPCVFDNTAAAIDYVQISPTATGECHDAGPNYPTAGGQVLGRVIEPSKTPPKIYLFGSATVAGTPANCSSSASPAVCGSASAGSVAVPSSASSLVVNTTAVTANSQITLQQDSSLSSRLGVSCVFTGAVFAVVARSPGTSFTISPSSLVANPECLSYVIIN